jgi:hypothetical protein
MRSALQSVNPPTEATRAPSGQARNRHEVGRCEIRLKGHLDGRWATWFDGQNLTLERGGLTTSNGPVIDQAALYRLPLEVRDVGLPLISVTYVDSAVLGMPLPTSPGKTRGRS